MFSCLKNKQDYTTDKIAYTLSWDGKSSTLNVHLKIPTKGEKEIILVHTPDPFDNKFECISELTIQENLPYIKKNNKYTIQNKDNKALIEVNYTINGKNKYEEKEKLKTHDVYRMYFLPDIKGDYLSLSGSHFLLNPENEAIASLLNTVSWKNVPEYLNKFDVINDKLVTTSEVNNSIFIFSRDLKVEEFDINNIPHYLIDVDKLAPHNQEKVTEAAKKLVPNTLRFFNDYDFPYYLAYVRQPPVAKLAKNVLGNRKGAMSAMAKGNGFTAAVLGEIGEHESLIILHESLHRWFKSLGKTFEHLWFNEGFNEYVTFYMAAGLDYISREKFEENLNNNLRYYYSVLKNFPEKRNNDYVRKNVEKDRSLMGANYIKGFIFAFYLDNKIRLSSNGSKTFQNLMIDYAIVRKNTKLPLGQNISLASFEKIVANYLPLKEVQSDIKKYMIKGAYIDFSKEKLMNGITLKMKPIVNSRNGQTDTIPVFKFMSKNKMNEMFEF